MSEGPSILSRGLQRAGHTARTASSAHQRTIEHGISRLSNDALLAIALLYYIGITHLTYVVIRTDGTWLYFANHIPFDVRMLWISIPASILVIWPITFAILRRSRSDPFALVLTPLLLLGAVPGAILFFLSDDLAFAALFVSFYFLLPWLLTHIQIPCPNYPRIQFGGKDRGPILMVGVLGVLIYCYLALKYHRLLTVPSFDQIYVVRAAFREASAGWEKYATTFAKFVSAFSLTTYSIASRRASPLIGVAFIFVLDYMLDANKLSIACLVLSCAIFVFFVIFSQNYQPYAVVLLLCVAQTILCVWIPFELPNSTYLVALYDRGFNVSATLFADYFNFAHQMGFLHGGNGLLGHLFGGVPIDYYRAIGERYFGPDTSANADMVSDAYVNFGAWGVLSAYVILRLLFNRRDITAYRNNTECCAVFLLPYSLALISMGLQTSMITGGFAFGLVVFKLIKFPQPAGI
jgi:hypothetical protein